MATKKKAAAKKRPKRKPKGKREKCTNKNICKYLEALDFYLNTTFFADYAQTKAAVCNLDRIVIREEENQPLWQMCPGGGTGTEPPAPPKPPKW